MEDAIEEIKENNLFQYPTERLVARMGKAGSFDYKRLDMLLKDDDRFVQDDYHRLRLRLQSRSTSMP